MQKREETCKMANNCNHPIKDCDPKCEFYNPKSGKDQEKLEKSLGEDIKKEEEKRPDVVLAVSDLPKFDKNFEIFVLKKHVFLLQSVSPKKIILKYKRKLSKTDNLPDGCYTFKNQKGELLDPVKVLIKTNHTKQGKGKSTDESADTERNC